MTNPVKTLLGQLREHALTYVATRPTAIFPIAGVLSCIHEDNGTIFIPSRTSTHVTVSALLLHPRQDSALMIREADEHSYSFWRFPGGHVSSRFSNLPEALTRYVRHQTGLTVPLTIGPLRDINVAVQTHRVISENLESNLWLESSSLQFSLQTAPHTHCDFLFEVTMPADFKLHPAEKTKELSGWVVDWVPLAELGSRGRTFNAERLSRIGQEALLGKLPA